MQLLKVLPWFTSLLIMFCVSFEGLLVFTAAVATWVSWTPWFTWVPCNIGIPDSFSIAPWTHSSGISNWENPKRVSAPSWSGASKGKLLLLDRSTKESKLSIDWFSLQFSCPMMSLSFVGKRQFRRSWQNFRLCLRANPFVHSFFLFFFLQNGILLLRPNTVLCFFYYSFSYLYHITFFLILLF